MPDVSNPPGLTESGDVDHDKTSNRTHDGDELSPATLEADDGSFNDSLTVGGTTTTDLADIGLSEDKLRYLGAYYSETFGESDISLTSNSTFADGQISLKSNIDTLLSRTTANNNPNSVAVENGYAYAITNFGDTFRIYDVSDPSNVVEVNNDAISNCVDVVVDGQYAYIAGNKLYVYDISDPNNLSRETYEDGTGAYDSVAVSGDTAYVSQSDSFVSLDVSDTSNITQNDFLRDAAYTGGTQEIKIDGDVAYMATGDADAVAAIDVSDPTNISLRDYVKDSSIQPFDISIKGDYVFVASESGSNRFASIDISNPDSLSIVDGISISDNLPSVDVNGSIAYVASKAENEILFVDISDPTNMSVTRTEGGYGGIVDLVFSDGLLYGVSEVDNELVVLGEIVSDGDALIRNTNGIPDNLDTYEKAFFGTSPDGETVTVDVEDSNQNVLKSNISDGVDLSDIDSSKEVRFRVNLSRTDTRNNPTFDYLEWWWLRNRLTGGN